MLKKIAVNSCANGSIDSGLLMPCVEYSKAVSGLIRKEDSD